MTLPALRAGDASVTVAPEAGGRIASIEHDGRALLRRQDQSPGTWDSWGSFPLLPWSNRIAGGRFTFDGVAHQMTVNWPDGSALHGLAASAPWAVDEATETTARLHADLAGGPYTVRGTQRFALRPDALEQTLGVENRGEGRLPFGLGIHPWFTFGPVRVPADSVWPSKDALPTGSPRPVSASDDLRRSIEPPLMDQCYTDLTEPAASVPGIDLSWSGPVTQVVVYTGVAGWVAVEPVTMTNDGFRLAAAGETGTGVVVLDPGESLEVSYTFTFTGWGPPRSDG